MDISERGVLIDTSYSAACYFFFFFFLVCLPRLKVEGKIRFSFNQNVYTST